ncbi:MAG: TonB-dependent siderophore receptor [Kiritimatiellia bacterium]
MRTTKILWAVLACAGAAAGEEGVGAVTNVVADLGTIAVESTALSRYRPEKVNGATFTDLAPEKSPTVVDTLTEDFIREHNPTDLHDLMRFVPGIETGGKSLLIRQPGTFSIRGMGGSEPAFDGVMPIGSGAGLFMDPFLMERVEIVKGPIGSLTGGAGAQQNNAGAGGSVNLYLKGAHLRDSERFFQENTSIGRNTWRQRGMIDANEVIADDAFAVRMIGAFDVFSPTYANAGSQKGADPRQSYTLAPSFVWKPTEDVTIGLKTMFQKTDQPSYIGIPVWRGSPAGGYGWYESSCRQGDRSKYESIYINPYVDWQVTDDWLLKFGGAFVFSDWEQTTREPYMNNAEAANFYKTGEWYSGNKYMTSSFSQSDRINRNYNLYVRSVYTKDELPWGFRNSLVVQPDFYYRESTSGFGAPVTRYGVTLQDSIGWGWVTLLGGVRCDYFRENEQTASAVNTRTGETTFTHYAHCDETAFSPRGGISIQPLDWLVFFANLSETVTPTLGYRDSDGSRPTDPWTATQYEGGFRVRPVEKLWFSASYYHITQENTPVAETVGSDTFYRFEGKNRSEGVELSLTGDITANWTVMAMYAYNRYRDCSATTEVFRRNPNHTFSLSTSYRFDCCDLLRDVVIGGSYRFRSKSYATMRGAFVDDNLYFDQSHVFDVNVSMPLSKVGFSEDWVLTLGVRNLFGEKYFESARHYYECLVGEPRTFEIGLRAKF